MFAERILFSVLAALAVSVEADSGVYNYNLGGEDWGHTNLLCEHGEE
jgi:hypothetical protein